MITLVLIPFFIVEACSAQCEGLGKNKCCSGYEWNETFGNCSKCKPGYFGLECRSHCTFPSYGEGCQHSCKSCSQEECDVSTGCPEKTTTYFYTTDIVKETTTHFHTTDHLRSSIATSKFVLTAFSKTTQHIRNKETSDNPTEQIDTIFTTKTFLILGVFGVSLILFTLLIVFSCKAIHRRCFSKQQSNGKRQVVRPVSDEEQVQYEEISDVRLLSASQVKYSPLRQNKMAEKVLLSEEANQAGYVDILSETAEDSSYTDTGLLDSSHLPMPVLDSTVTDAEGYEIPRSPVTRSREITEDTCVIVSADYNEKNDDYLTVVSNDFERG